jgi:hypothetical protein
VLAEEIKQSLDNNTDVSAVTLPRRRLGEDKSMASAAALIGRCETKRLLVVLLSLCCCVTSVCYANAGDDAGAARANMTFGTNTRHGPVLTIPAGDCRDAAFVLARVTRHIRDAERSALYIAQAEDEYDDALEDLIEGNCATGIEHLRTSDSILLQQASGLVSPSAN